MDLSELGKTSISKIKITDTPTEYVKTNSLIDDFYNGLPKGRIIDVAGHADTGKTTFAMYLISLFQQLNLNVFYIDSDYAFNMNYADRLNVNPDELNICQPEYGEQAIEMIKAIAETKTADLIIIDSIAGLVPSWELNGDMGDITYAAQYHMIANTMPKLVLAARQSGTIILFINRLSRRINTREITTIGNRIMNSYATMRFTVEKDSILRSGVNITGLKLLLTLTEAKQIIPNTNQILLPIKFRK